MNQQSQPDYKSRNSNQSKSDKNANILTLPETQCQWLREIGFKDVDCFFRIFEIALFGGVKPN